MQLTVTTSRLMLILFSNMTWKRMGSFWASFTDVTWFSLGLPMGKRVFLVFSLFGRKVDNSVLFLTLGWWIVTLLFLPRLTFLLQMLSLALKSLMTSSFTLDLVISPTPSIPLLSPLNLLSGSLCRGSRLTCWRVTSWRPLDCSLGPRHCHT